MEIVENSFQKKHSNQYKLSILLRMDSLVYTVNQDSRILLLKTVEFKNPQQKFSSLKKQLSEFLKDEKLLRLSYKHIAIAIQAPVFTLVPDRLFNADEKKTYLAEVAKASAGDRYCSDKLPGIESQIVYTLDRDINELLKQYFPHAQYEHSHTSLISYFASIAKKERDAPVIYLHFRNRHFDIFLFENGKFQFCNTYALKSAKDSIYYLLLVFEQFHLDQHKTCVKLCGEITKPSDVYKYIYKYISQNEFLTLPENIEVDDKLRQQNLLLYFNLFTLSQSNQ